MSLTSSKGLRLLPSNRGCWQGRLDGMVLINLCYRTKEVVPSVPNMRWNSHVSILAILVCMFIIPHDPSTRLPSSQVGSDAFGVGHTPPPKGKMATSGRTDRPIVPLDRRGGSPQAAAVSLPSATPWPTVSWLARCALARPVQTSRVAARLASRTWSAPSPALAELQQQQQQQQQQLAELLMSNASAITSGEFALPTTVEMLREQLGGRQRWWGDLSAAEARQLYHSLLPWYLLDDRLAGALSLSERARLAVTARHAARLYVRERALLPLAIGCELFDGARQLWEHGTFQPQGMSEEQVRARTPLTWRKTKLRGGGKREGGGVARVTFPSHVEPTPPLRCLPRPRAAGLAKVCRSLRPLA